MRLRTIENRLPRSRFLLLRLPVLAVLVSLLGGVLVSGARPAESEDAVARIVARMDKRPADRIWADVRRLEELGDPAVPDMRGALDGAEPTARLGLASALLRLGQADVAAEALLALAREASDRSVRTHAVRVLSEVDRAELAERIAAAFLEQLEETFSPKEKIELAKGIWRVSPEHRRDAKEVLREVRESVDPETRLEAGLAFAEIGDTATARSILREFQDDPTLRGDLARAYLAGLEQRERIALLDRRLREAPSTLPRDELDRGRIRHYQGKLAQHLEGPASRFSEAVVDELAAHEFLEEVIARVRAHYIDAEDLETESLYDAAATGILDALDLHSSYFSPEDLEKWTFDLDRTYAGIGAYVNEVDGRMTVIRPVYSGPAYSAGLRSGDWILEVDGWPTQDAPIDEITRRLKGRPGSRVTLRVMRRTWSEPRAFELRRELIDIPTARSELLPGGIGYLRLESFGIESAAEVEEQLQALESQGMRGLILDLRDNSGGYLTTARKIVDKFLPAGKLIVECKGPNGLPVYDSEGHYQYFTSDNFHHDEIPMVVLLNGSSASASEIVAGCLQAHGRAKIVGERSYGKGSVQNVFPLRTRPSEPHTDRAMENGTWDEGEAFTDTDGNGRYDYGEPWEDAPRRNGRWDAGERFVDKNDNGVRDEGEPFNDQNDNSRYDPPEDYRDLNDNGRWDRGPAVKITIARYYLPGGRSIHREVDAEGRVVREGGVLPDIEQSLDDVSTWVLEEIDALLDSEQIKNYIDGNFDRNRELFLSLARFDGFETDRYPGFDQLYEKIETHVPRNQIRRLLRSFVRRRAQDLMGREFLYDLQEDAQLQRSIHHLAGEIGLSLETIPVLAHIRSRFET